MLKQETATFPLQVLSDHIRALDKSCSELSKLMDRQLNAVIASDAEQIMQLTEDNAEAQQAFHNNEKKLIDELKELIPESKEQTPSVTLGSLKRRYPDYSLYISEWQKNINDNARRLQRQQSRLVQLLEFAQKQNAHLMQSIYNMHSEKDRYYLQNGKKSAAGCGVAVNHEG